MNAECDCSKDQSQCRTQVTQYMTETTNNNATGQFGFKIGFRTIQLLLGRVETRCKKRRYNCRSHNAKGSPILPCPVWPLLVPQGRETGPCGNSSSATTDHFFLQCTLTFHSTCRLFYSSDLALLFIIYT